MKRPEASFYIKLVSPIILFQSLFSSAYNAFIGLDKTEQSAIIKIIMSIIKTFLVPVLIILGLGITGAILGHMLSYIVAGFIGFLLIFTNSYKFNLSNKNSDFIEDIKSMIHYGFPLYISSLLSTIVSQYLLILLAIFTSNFEIGNFNAAVKLTTLITIPILV